MYIYRYIHYTYSNQQQQQQLLSLWGRSVFFCARSTAARGSTPSGEVFFSSQSPLHFPNQESRPMP